VRISGKKESRGKKESKGMKGICEEQRKERDNARS
jgi:hypothetical protein